MLYITTRNDREVFTAQSVMQQAVGPDGGRFLPYRHPKMTRQTFEALAKKPFAGRIAWMLNHLFGSKCSLWDVEFAAGRSPIRLVSLGSRLYLAQTWYNPGWDYETMAVLVPAAGTGGACGVGRHCAAMRRPHGNLHGAVQSGCNESGHFCGFR